VSRKRRTHRSEEQPRPSLAPHAASPRALRPAVLQQRPNVRRRSGPSKRRRAGGRPHPLSTGGRRSEVRTAVRPVASVGLAERETASGPMRISASWQRRRDRRSRRGTTPERRTAKTAVLHLCGPIGCAGSFSCSKALTRRERSVSPDRGSSVVLARGV
jgi:hypothetical protein